MERRSTVLSLVNRAIIIVMASLPLTPSKATETPSLIAELEESYFKKFDAWVAAGGKVETIEAEVGQTCGKLIFMNSSPTEYARYTADKREDFDMYMDMCIKITVNRVHKQDFSANQKMVDAACKYSLPIIAKVCDRAGLK